MTAVLILVNGAVPRSAVGRGTDYVLSTLVVVFPKPLINKIAFMFTSVLNALAWHFCQDAVPAILKNAPQLQIGNPSRSK